MVSYLNTIKDTESKLCSPQVFDQLTHSPMVKQLIEDYRRGNSAAKQLLPSFMFQGYDPNVLLGKTGSRKASRLSATGMFIMDFDHIEAPIAVFDKYRKVYSDMAGDHLALAHVTPSGKGLRLVLKIPAGKSIEEAQAEVEQRLEVKMDGVVKDLSRQSFCPLASDILYINKELLFKTPDNHDTTRTDNSTAVDRGNEHAARLPKGTNNTGEPSGESNALRAANAFNPYFRGIPRKKIVEALIEIYGGMPEVGNRENTLFRLASDMARITDRSAPWLESLLPTFGLPEAEWRATIAQVCKKPLQTSFSRNLQEALQRCKCEDSNDDGETVIGEYKDNFPEKAPAMVKLLTSRCMPHMKPALSQMCFPALAAHVEQHKFLMSDNSKQELALMAVLIGKQSNGKSCIDEPIKCIIEDIVAIDNINRAREKEYNEKQRNRKANEKGEKRPDDIIIRCLGGNCSNPKLLELLTAAEKGDPEHPNQCLYSEVTEIQRLYKMGTDNGKFGVSDLIKAAFDRAMLDSNRFSSAACNAYTPARWNFSAATTPEGAVRFFSGTLLSDGTLSRVAFVMLPEVDIPSNEFNFGCYDEEFKRELAYYIKNLKDYKHPVDSEGKALPVYVPQANELRKKINDIIDIEKRLENDKDTYLAYAYRTRDIVVREALTCYIANGCVWEDCEDYWLWVYSELMATKLAVFGEKAAEKFASEKIHKGGRKPAISFMPKKFTKEHLIQFSSHHPNICSDPKRNLRTWIREKVVTVEDGQYIISDEVCKLYGIS